ncbi:MAG: cysteine desulfurase family protein [Planctomycetota bacterium]
MIYLDYNATTPLAPEVREKLAALIQLSLGNPSSLHKLGQEAAVLLLTARQQIAQSLGCLSSEIIFTSSGTESDLSALRGVLQATQKKHLVISAVEHPAIRLGAIQLKKQGYSVTEIGVSSTGTLNWNTLQDAITEQTALVSMMMANNETGILFPIQEIAQLCQQKKILFHTDAVQAWGKIPLQVQTLGVDLLSVSGHKIYGPTGCGVLYLRKGTPFEPLIPGHQETERRGGTENLFGIVGTGVAASLISQRLLDGPRLQKLRDLFEEKLRGSSLAVRFNGSETARVPNTSNVSFSQVDSQRLLMLLNREQIYCSSGSACSAGKKEPSSVLKAMKVPSQDIFGTLRISLGSETTLEQIEFLCQVLKSKVPQLVSK